MTPIPFGRPQIVSLDRARPHVTAPCRCAACEHEWVAVVPAPAPETLECPECREMTNAARHAQVHTALKVVESLRQDLLNGRIVAFAGVGIEEDDTTRMWCTATAPVSRLRCMGAIAHLLHMYQHGEDLT